MLALGINFFKRYIRFFILIVEPHALTQQSFNFSRILVAESRLCIKFYCSIGQNRINFLITLTRFLLRHNKSVVCLAGVALDSGFYKCQAVLKYTSQQSKCMLLIIHCFFTENTYALS